MKDFKLPIFTEFPRSLPSNIDIILVINIEISSNHIIDNGSVRIGMKNKNDLGYLLE
ncbi:hypothetical protein TUM4641_35470 [Shewanella morhuae]|nr:hypothetical protein TUM4641_35470 [Shewanella morhuae]